MLSCQQWRRLHLWNSGKYLDCKSINSELMKILEKNRHLRFWKAMLWAIALLALPAAIPYVGPIVLPYLLIIGIWQYACWMTGSTDINDEDAIAIMFIGIIPITLLCMACWVEPESFEESFQSEFHCRWLELRDFCLGFYSIWS